MTQGKNSKNQKNAFPILVFVIVLLKITICFQFKSPQISVNPTTINAHAQYTINLQRQFTPNVTNTQWNTIAVPSGSAITVTFPPEFALSGSESCDMVLIGGNSPATFACSTNTANNVITISGAIDSDQFISDVNLIISNVLNPFPALTTSSFLATIGIDYTSNDPFAAVTLSAGAFASAAITFAPATVNTTGNMVFTLMNGNRMPQGSSIVVQFPVGQAWSEDVSASVRKLPIMPAMSCSSLSPSLALTITCAGQSTVQTVTISALSGSQIPAMSTIKFSINDLFSPPTQGHSDTVIITSYIGSYQIDTISSTITGLVAKTLTDLTIVSTGASKPINTNVGLRVSFTLQDTVTSADYFELTFPAGTTVANSTALSSFSLSTFTYSSSTLTLTFNQNTGSQTRFAGFFANITFLTYRTPNSTKPSDPIVLRVMKNGFAKMRGSAVFVADPKQYSFTVTTNDTNPNAYAQYQIVFNLADALDKTGYFIIRIPAELIISTLSCTLTSSSPTSVNPSPILSQINSTSYKIWNLNRTQSALMVPTQTLTITFMGIQQPNSVRSVSSFGLEVYFGVEGYLTANGAQTGTISIVGGSIGGAITSTSVITATVANLSVVLNLKNAVPANGYIYVTVPSQISLATLSFISLAYTSTSTPIPLLSSNQNQSIITLRPSSPIPSLSSINLTLASVLTPISTETTSALQAITTNQNNFTIDTLSGLVNFTVSQARQLNTLSVQRGSTNNYDATSYRVGLYLNTSLYSTVANFVTLQFPPQIGANTSTLVTTLLAPDNSTTTPALTTLSTSPFKISLSLPASTFTLNHTLIFTNLINPLSLKQTSSGIVATVAYIRNSTTYFYGQGESSLLQNSGAGVFPALTYAYSTGFLFADATLVTLLGLAGGSSVSALTYQLDSSVGLKNTTALANCTSLEIAIICTITSTSPPIIRITPSSSPTFSLTNITVIIGIITTPTFYSVSYSPSILTSYDAANYVISRSTTVIKFNPSCSLPCRECQTNQPTYCLSCFTPSQNITNLLYFATVVGQSYGQCYSSCPSGYSSTLASPYLCFRCDSNCAQCLNSPTTCTSCNTSMSLYLVNNTCVTTCPNGTYAGSLGGVNVCLNCTGGCDVCTISTVCQVCSMGMFLYNSTCGTGCPVNYTVANSLTRSCDSCSINCITCQGTTNNCTSCPAGLVLTNGSCSSSCPSTSMIPINGTCTPCSPTCLTCSISVSNCTSCNTTSASVYKYLSNGQCLSVCPTMYYSTASLGYVCALCSGLPINCADCSSNGMYCLSCNVGYVYFNNSQCLSNVPFGYINISGVATPCASPCLTCSITTTNCTSCPSPLVLYLGACQSLCPNSTTAVNGSCQPCSSTCTQCSSTPSFCTSCTNPSFLNPLTHQCVASNSCPSYSYPNSTTSTCASCTSPCLSCTTAISCSSCVRGFYFESLTTLCLDVCPFGWVGVVDVCVRCLAPCRSCQQSVDNCTSCVSGYYMNRFTFQCLLQCPAQVSISNPVTMTCDQCVSPCSTCQNQTALCSSCVSGTYLLGSQCLTVCPDGYYGQLLTKKCTQCSSSCLTCTTSPTRCTSCYPQKYLYIETCISQCPVTHAIIGTGNICQLCSTALAYCLTCTASRVCLACLPEVFLVEGACYTGCPSGYVYDQAKGACISVSQNAEQQLTTTLTSSSVFPMPFTCIGVSIFIAFVMSKLQNKNTYLIGASYSLSGMLQTGSLIYLIIKYINYSKTLQSSISQLAMTDQFPLISIGLIIIYAINMVGLMAQTPILCGDTKFQGWLKNASHKFFFISCTILSVLVNYKIKLLIFSKLFNLTSTRAQLQSVQKFRIFNILSFLGVSHEIFVIYISAITLTKLPSLLSNELFLVLVDAMVVSLISILLSIAANKKDDEFFAQETDNGYVLNKQVQVQGDDLCKEGLEPKFLRGQENKNKDTLNQMDSFQKMLNNERQEIYEDQQLALSISENRSEIDARERNRKQKMGENNDNGRKVGKNKNQLHFIHEQTSNPIKKQWNEPRQQLIRHSVIFQQNKQYDQDDTVSKNKTVLLQSPAKHQSKLESKPDNKLNKPQLDALLELEPQIANSSGLRETKDIKVQGDDRSGGLKSGENVQLRLEKQKQQQKQRQRKQNETKIFVEQKNVMQNQQEIENKIKSKLQLLKTLKKENSSKDLRRSREKSRQKATTVRELIEQKGKNKEDHKSTLNCEKKEEKQKVCMVDEGVGIDETIPEVSMLVRQEEEKLKVKQNQKEPIKQQFDLAKSMDPDEGKSSKKGTIIKIQKSKPNEQDQIEETYILERSDKQNSKSKKTQNNQIQEEDGAKNKPNAINKDTEQSKTKFSKKQNIENMYDSFINTGDNEKEQQTSAQGKVEEEITKNEPSNKSKIKHGIDIAIGEEVNQEFEESGKGRQNKDKGNIFEFEQEEESMEDSGLEDSRPGADEQINHHPLKSSFASQIKSGTGTNNDKTTQPQHPLIGILHANQPAQVARNKIPKTADEEEIGNREDAKTRIMKYPINTGEEKTERRQPDRPPLQRPVSTQKNRIYAAGLRQLQDQTLTKKNQSHNALREQHKMKNSFQQQINSHAELPNKKRNGSLYNVPLKRLDSKDSRELTSSDHTEDMLVRPGYFNQNSSSEDVSFAHPKYTSTMNVDSGNEMPDKPTINITSRTSVNRQSFTSHERGGRIARQQVDQNVTAGSKMFTKKSSAEYEDEQGQDDQLNQFYGTIKDNKGRSPKRSRSKQRNPSKESVKRMKQLEKVYLQRLDMPKKK